MQFTLNRRSTVRCTGSWLLNCVNRLSPAQWLRAIVCRLNASWPHASRINRTTVLQAYQQLKDEGLIASKVGKGTFVLPLQHIETARIPVSET